MYNQIKGYDLKDIIFGDIYLIFILFQFKYLLCRKVQKKCFGIVELSIFPNHALTEDPVDESFRFQSSNRVVPWQH